LELSAINGLLLTSHPDVPLDINNKLRPVVSPVGAYTQPPTTHDAMLVEMTAWEERFIKDQSLQVNVDLVNLCDASTLTIATLGWSINGQVQQPSITWNASPALQPYKVRNVLIGFFNVPNVDTIRVKVWVESLNGQADIINWNDTVSAFAVKVPLAEFVNPIKDTITSRTFTVNMLIRTQTGAPASPPEMTLHTIVNGEHLYDTIAIVQNGDIWQANIPQQYYESRVIYSTIISDMSGNSIALTDSTFISYSDESIDQYTGYNLSILALTEPVNRNISGKSCSDEDVPLTIVLANTGENDYDFSIRNVPITVESVRDTIPYTYTTMLDSGILKSGETDTIVIDPAFPIYMPGQYDIKIWLTSAIDNIIYDDTITHIYISERLGLPIDENFSGNFPPEFIPEAINSSAVWTIVSQGSGADTVVKPVFGSGMLSFTGTRGAMTHLSTRQLELRGTVLPAMEFWYFHDTVESEDYMDVRITTDGGTTYTQLFSLLKQNAVYGWAHYAADLTPYVNGQCINILFEAMQMSPGVGSQYIDSINFSSFPDLAVSELLLPEITVCDMENKDLGIVLSATGNQTIDLSLYNTSLIVEVPGRAVDIIPLNKKIDRNASDTVWLSSVNLLTGNNTVRAYLSAPVDIFPVSDTLIQVIGLNPKMSVSIDPQSMPNKCLTGEFVVYPSVRIYNEGNMDLSDIGLIFQIDTGETGSPAYIVLKETCTDTILAGNSHAYTFKSSYTVPWKADYYSRITVYLQCDSALIDTVNALTECVDVKDLYIVSVDNPPAGKDRVGDAIQVKATLHNRSDHDNFNNGVNITVLVTNSQRTETARFTEVTGAIGTLATVSHTFTQTYTVPNDSVYYLTVYIDSYENYPDNDTKTITRYTDGVGIESLNATNAFTLGQNIPNPANNSTRIDYSVPEAGEVVFHVHSISGQLLYSKTIEASRGTNSIELNTSTFAAGVYVYSMEYKGQKQVRQLIISN
jgi:hypothetical protein